MSFAAVQVAGTCLGFTLNKYWAFEAAHSARTSVEGARSVLVFCGSFVLNVVLPSCAMYAWNVPAVRVARRCRRDLTVEDLPDLT